MTKKYKKEKKDFEIVEKMWKKANSQVDEYIKKDIKVDSLSFK